MSTPRWHGLVFLGVAAALTLATPAAAEMRPASRPVAREHGAYSRDIAEASARYGVPERLIWSVIRVESSFDPRAVSPKGARGLMQLMPETATMLGVRDSFDPRQNIDGGTRHLRAMMERFRHDLPLAVAAYNAGEKPVVQYGGIPPYPETQGYVRQVLSLYGLSVDHLPMPRTLVIAPARVTGFRKIVQPDGAVLYTNIAYGSR
jgi:soluble lytic murein transglycosylase-like protein